MTPSEDDIKQYLLENVSEEMFKELNFLGLKFASLNKMYYLCQQINDKRRYDTNRNNK